MAVIEPWRVPARSPAEGRYRLGPEFPGCYNTGTRPILAHISTHAVPSTGQKYIVCYELDREAVQFVVISGQAKGKRVLKKQKGWHGDAQVFKTRGPAVAAFEAWCEELQAKYDAMRTKANELQAIVKAKAGTPEAIAAALELSDLIS